MNKFLISLSAVAFLLAPSMVAGQTAYSPNKPVSDTNPPPSKPMCWISNAWAPCPAGGGGGGDATAANQTTQITAAQLTNTTLGAVAASPTANTIGDRLKTINTTLGFPFQAGGSIGNTSFGISGTLPAFGSTPTVNLGTLNGAALDATVSAQSAKLPASLGAKTGATSLSVVPNTDTAFPVTGTFWQATQPVSGTVAATQSGTWNINNIAGTVSLPTGAATAANLTSQQTPLTPATGTATVALAVGARYDLTVPTWTDTQQGALGVDTRGNLRVSLYSSGSSAGIVGLADNADAVAVTSSTNRLATASRQYVYNGTSWDRAAGNTAGQFVQGNIASGSADSGNPVKVGCKYNATKPTLTDGLRGDCQTGTRGAMLVQLALPDNANAVAFIGTGTDGYANNAINAYNSNVFNNVFDGATWNRMRGDTNGTIVQPFAVASSRWIYAAASGGISNTTTAVTFIAAAGVGVRNYVTAVTIASDALTNATELAIRDGASGTVLWRSKIQTSGLPMTTIAFAVPLKGTANTLMEVVTLTASGAGAVYFDAQGFQGS